MRLCRLLLNGKPQVGLYDESRVIPLETAALIYARETGDKVQLPEGDCLLQLLPQGEAFSTVSKIAKWAELQGTSIPDIVTIPTAEAELLVPIPSPKKILLLAGNYADHIREGGGIASERAETFPYVFMKPPSTTLVNPGSSIQIPRVSPGAIDWELELAVIIGKTCKGVAERDALEYVAGYTVINDISNRKFRPNPERKKREKDGFFDWLHGKWHDSFCPCGPCVTSADSIADPQSLKMQLTLNGDMRQNASTSLQIFPVAAVIEFISSFVTLEPGDMISTGTPAGVGNTTGTFLKSGDTLHATIEHIGTLLTPVISERI